MSALEAAETTSAQPETQPVSSHGQVASLFIGGVGGVYFLAEPGELIVEVEKRDRNRRGARTDLRALLVGPDRRVLQEEIIPDDGQPKGSGLGPVRKCRLSATVPAKGIYALNITVSQDRYGEEAIWSFRSNCRKYVIETARGHKDERHQEPIVLASPEREASLCFMPRREAFDIEITGLPKGTAPLEVLDVRGVTLAALPVNAQGEASHRFPRNPSRGPTPWGLQLPSAQAIVNIDGLTRWDSGDLYPDMACWTPDPESWFPFLENRWLLTPYSRTVYGERGERKEITFQLHNNSAREKTVRLLLDFPDTKPGGGELSSSQGVKLSADRVVLGPKQVEMVTVKCTIPETGSPKVVRLRATPEDKWGFTTYSTLRLKSGVAPASRPLTMPIQLEPYEHENEQFGYLPDYPVENQVYFDLQNRPFIGTRHGFATLGDGSWATSALGSAEQTRTPSLAGASFDLASTKIAFDGDNNLYALATAGRTAALLRSTDGAKTFAACAIPGREDRPRSFDIEQFSGCNLPEDPPPILRYTQTARDEKLIWRRLNDLELFLPRKQDGTVMLGDPILISRKCIGTSSHSGIASAVVSRGSKVHVVWGEATDPQEKLPGVPTFVTTFDRETRRLGKPVLVAHGPPANDVHNSPSITVDTEGYLHVLAGTHGRPFPYVHSLQPNHAEPAWTEPAAAGQNLSQTYIGLVCGPDDTLHSVFRLWRSGEPFPASSYGTLAYQRKRPGQPWEAPRILVVAPFSEYSVFYHRLTIDRKGRLFLSYDYWSTFWFYRNDHFGRRRALLMSADGGKTWKLAETADMGQRVEGHGRTTR